jgi:phage anti-repressor protein
MNNLIQLHFDRISGENAYPVDARELHAVLQVGKDFSTWLKDRIAKYGYQESIDYTENLDSPNLGNQKSHGGDRRSIDYSLTLDMAKELAMLEGNERGRMARRYFIQAEKHGAVAAHHVAALQRELLQSCPELVDVLNLKRCGYSGRRIAGMLRCGETKVRGQVNKLKACGFDLVWPQAPAPAGRAGQFELTLET